MKVNIKFLTSTCHSKTILIAAILTFIVFPLLWIIAENHNQWLLLATLLWAIGTVLIFYPFIEHIYPHMLTKTGILLLTAILTIISVWFNIMMITFLLPDHYLYHTVLNATLEQISLIGILYISASTTTISHIDLVYGRKSYKEDKLF